MLTAGTSRFSTSRETFVLHWLIFYQDIVNGSYYFLVDDYFKVSAVFCRIKAPFLGNSFFVQSQRKFFLFFYFFIFMTSNITLLSPESLR